LGAYGHALGMTFQIVDEKSGSNLAISLIKESGAINESMSWVVVELTIVPKTSSWIEKGTYRN